MKNYKIIPLILTLLAALTACGPQATPTMNPADVQNTAVAAAWTVVAMTDAAKPPTPMPPPPQPSPTVFVPQPGPTAQPVFTSTIPVMPDLFASPTTESAIFIPPTATFSSMGNVGGTPDPCNGPLSPVAQGRKVKTRVVNQSSGWVLLSFYLDKTQNVWGECGYLGLTVDRNGSSTIELIEGCYWIGANVNDINNKPNNDTNMGRNVCISAPNATITVTKDNIKD